MAVVGTGVVVGLALGYSQRPVGMCVLAIAGLILVLLCLTVLRNLLASLLSTLVGRRGAHFVQGPIVRVGLWILLLLVSLVAVLWPATLPWTLFAALSLLGASASVELLRLDPDFGVSEITADQAKARSWAWGSMRGLCGVWFMALVPGQVVHALGGPLQEAPSTVLARAIGDFESRVMARFDRQDEVLDEHSDKIDAALAILERQESQLRELSDGGLAPPGPLPLSPQDYAILNAAKPFADALTKYRIAVAEGDDEAAVEWELEVLARRDQQRAEEDFLFERARGDRHFNAGRYDEAVPAYREAQTLRPDDPSALRDLSIALFLSRRSQNYREALLESRNLVQTALSIRRSAYSADHPELAADIAILGSFQVLLGNFTEARQSHAEALGMRRRLYRGDHPDIAASLSGLAEAFSGLGRIDEAVTAASDSLAMCRRLYTEDHPDTATSLNNLAIALRDTGHLTQSELLLTEALNMRRRLYENGHPHVGVSLSNLASMLKRLERAPDAEAMARESLDMQRRFFRGDHPLIAHSMFALGDLLASFGRIDEAEPLLLASLDMLQNIYGTDHPDISYVLSSLSLVNYLHGRPGEAELLCIETLAMRRRLFEGDHPTTASSLVDLSIFLTQQNRWDDALPLLTEAVEMGRRCLPPDHPKLGDWIEYLRLVEEHLDV